MLTNFIISEFDLVGNSIERTVLKSAPGTEAELLAFSIWKYRRKTKGNTEIFCIRPGIVTPGKEYQDTAFVIAVKDRRVIYFSNMRYTVVEEAVKSIEENLDMYTDKFPHGKLGIYNCIEVYLNKKNTIKSAVSHYYIMQVLRIVKSQFKELCMLRGFQH